MMPRASTSAAERPDKYGKSADLPGALRFVRVEPAIDVLGQCVKLVEGSDQLERCAVIGREADEIFLALTHDGRFGKTAGNGNSPCARMASVVATGAAVRPCPALGFFLGAERISLRGHRRRCAAPVAIGCGEAEEGLGIQHGEPPLVGDKLNCGLRCAILLGTTTHLYVPVILGVPAIGQSCRYRKPDARSRAVAGQHLRRPIELGQQCLRCFRGLGGSSVHASLPSRGTRPSARRPQARAGASGYHGKCNRPNALFPSPGYRESVFEPI